MRDSFRKCSRKCSWKIIRITKERHQEMMSTDRNIPPDADAPGWNGDESKHVLEFASQHGSVPRDLIATLWPLLRLQSGPGKDRAEAFVSDYERGLKTDAEAQQLADDAKRLVWSQGLSLNDSMIRKFTPTAASIEDQFRPRSALGAASGFLGDGRRHEEPVSTVSTSLPSLSPTVADTGLANSRGDGLGDIDLSNSVQRGDGRAPRVVEPKRYRAASAYRPRDVVSYRRTVDL